MRYLLIDRVKELVTNNSIIAIKNVTLSEDIFNEHFVGVPVFPGALIIESLAQAGTVLLEYSNDMKFKALLVMVKSMKFRSIISPGDRMIIKEKIVSKENFSYVVDCLVYVEDKLVADGELIFALKNVDEYYPQKYFAATEGLYDIWLKDTLIKNEE